MSDIKTLIADGLWSKNPALIQLLGICPLLAITTTLVNGLALGLATTVVLICTNSIVSLIRNALLPSVRILIFVMIISSLVTTVDLLTNAFFHDLHEILGLFIPLIITNCTILAQAESVASRNSLGKSIISGGSSGLGFTAVLVVLGGLREIIGRGSLFSGLDMLLGDSAANSFINFPFNGALVAILPPGAFFGLAILIALRNLSIPAATINQKLDTGISESPE